MEEIPKSIRTAIVKPKERVFLLRLEKDLINFISDIQVGKYFISSNSLINSYYRLLGHQLCQYYQLQHWNLQNCDIIVTPSEDVNYAELMIQIEVGAKEKVSTYVHNTKPQEVPVNPDDTKKILQPKIKPRMLKKDTSSDTSLSLNNSSDVIDRVENGTNESEISPTTESSTPQSQNMDSDTCKIQNDKNSKEALYMKVRQEIFEEQNNDDEDEEEEDDEGEDEEDEEDYEDDVAQNYYRKQYGYSQINPPAFGGYDNMPMSPNMMPPPMMGMPYGMPPMGTPFPPTYSPTYSPTQNYSNNYPSRSRSHSNVTYSRSRSQSQTNSQTTSGTASQTSSPSQQQKQPHFPPSYANMYGGPMPYYNGMMAPQMPSGIPSGNGGYYLPYNGNYGLPYDKETERKLLNNPYIIIPDTHHKKKKPKPKFS